MLQFWYGSNLTLIKNKIKARSLEDRQGGHSVIFKSYIKDSSGSVTGFKYYDYSGISKSAIKGDGSLFLGANLKDIK